MTYYFDNKIVQEQSDINILLYVFKYALLYDRDAKYPITRLIKEL